MRRLGGGTVSVPDGGAGEDVQPSGLPAGGARGARASPTTISFKIQQPSGKPLTAYRTCCDPHAGVDLIIVRSDDSHLQYDDSDIGARRSGIQPVVFPTPGRYRVIIDAYPAHASPTSRSTSSCSPG